MLTFTPELFPDESLNGYWLRLAEENGLAAAGTLFGAMGLRLKARYTNEECECIAEELGLDVSRLRWSRDFGAVYGSLSSSQFLRTDSIPVCPCCLKQAAYIRQAWHHKLVTACAEHGVILIDECPSCEAKLSLNRANVEQCSCGCCLSSLSPEPASPGARFVAELLSPEHVPQSFLRELNDDAQVPSDVDHFVVFLANLSLPTAQRKNASIDFARAQAINDACFALAESLSQRFAAFVEEKVRQANEQAANGFFKHLGSWYRALDQSFGGTAYSSLRAIAYRIIVEQARAPINRKMKQFSAELLGHKSTLTTNEAARTLQSSPDRIVSMVKAGSLAGVVLSRASREFCVVDRQAVEAEREAAARFVNAKEVSKRLNVTRRVRDRLIESGVLAPVCDRDLPAFAKGQFPLSAVAGLLEILEAHYSPRPCTSALSLEELSARRYSNDQANQLYQAIFTGKLEAVGRSEQQLGLAAFRFDQRDVESLLRDAGRGLFELTITDLVRVTNWKHESIKAWVKQGLLRARTETHSGQKRTLISIGDLIAFLSSHVVAADAAQRLNSKSIWITNALACRGVVSHGAGVSETGVRRGVLLSVDALINVASGRPAQWRRLGPDVPS